MPELKFTKPCSDCPFRRESTQGWLGAGTPESFTKAALADYVAPGCELPCHQTIDYSDPAWRDQVEGSAHCAGALIFAANNFKLPRDPERSALVHAVGESPDVFDSEAEFVEHHRTGLFRSWEDVERDRKRPAK